MNVGFISTIEKVLIRSILILQEAIKQPLVSERSCRVTGSALSATLCSIECDSQTKSQVTTGIKCDVQFGSQSNKKRIPYKTDGKWGL